MNIQINFDHNDDPGLALAVLAAAYGGGEKTARATGATPTADAVREMRETLTEAVAEAPKVDPAAQPEKPKRGRRAKVQAEPVEDAKPAPAAEPVAEAPKTEKPKSVDAAMVREALAAVAAKAGGGDQLGGIAKVEEILGQFGVAKARDLKPEQMTECWQLCQDFLGA